MLVGNIALKLRKRETPFWRFLYHKAKSILCLHLPVIGPLHFFYQIVFYIHVFLREAMIWCLKFFYYEPLFRARCEHVGRRLHMEKLPYIVGSGKIRIGDDVFLSGKSNFIVGHKLCDSSVLEIGNNSQLGHGCSIVAGLRVSIGNNVMIAGGTTIRDNDGHPLDALERRQGLPVRREDIQPVEIKDDVWIGSHTYIGRGVVIGERSIIGAYAVVRRSIPPDSIVIGHPARVTGNVNDQLIKQSKDS
jgi:acetyltransferase-like isoleucine patch superfamily enzyme